MTNNIECPKCGGKMIRGRLYIVATEGQKNVDHLFGYVNWEATEEKKFDGLYAFKCESCGYIEYYAKKKS